MDVSEEPSPMEIEARALVRQFSDELQNRECTPTDLEEALQKGVEGYDADSRRRRQVFQSSAHGGRSFDRANTECEKVQHAWTAFLAELDEDYDGKSKTPWKSRRKPTSVDHQLKSFEVSTIKDVLAEVDSVQKSWIEKDRILGGKAQEYFHRACFALSEHDVVFDMIPNQNNYAATLCGSMRMLIRASANHVKYAEELGHALSDISDEIGQANLLLAVMRVPEMEQRVEELYIKIFHLFRRAISWYQSSGFRKIRFGLNEGLYERLKDDVAAVKAQALSIQRDASARGLVESRETRLIAENTAVDSRETRIITEATFDRVAEAQQTGDATFLHVYQMRQQMAREREERQKDKAELHNLLLTLGQRLADGLTDQAVQLLVESANRERRLSEAQRTIREVEESVPLPAAQPNLPRSMDRSEYARNANTARMQPQAQQRYRSVDLVNASEHLDDFITGLDERDLSFRKAPHLTSGVVANKLQNWSRSDAAERLWISGPPQHGVPSALVGAAVTVLKTSQFLQIPIIAHACDRGRTTANGMSKEQAGFLGLVYSLIRQLIVLLPESISTQRNLSSARFKQLDGTLDCWHGALDMLTDLLACCPPLVLCLIDGLNQLESSTTTDMCSDLLDLLDEALESNPDEERVLKVLFTSSGNSRTLRDWFDPQETCMIEEAPPTRQSSNNLGEGSTPLVLRDFFDGSYDED